VSKSGWFLGSAGSLFLEQLAADIYLQDYWPTVGYLFRMVTLSVSWGISLVFIETAFRARQGEEPTPWQHAANALWTIDVEDRGQQPIFNDDRPDIPLIEDIAPPPPPIAIYEIHDGPVIMGRCMPWHHAVVITKVQGKKTCDTLFHYHEHDARVGHGPAPPILPRNEGKHYIFHSLTYTTQVQNCRRA
ncbi:hypothetical protein LXA43DRAFT_864244, partial [Ganoderma leucocontextum]